MYPALHCIVSIACQKNNHHPQSWSFGNTILNLVRSILILYELTDLKVTEVLLGKLIIIIILKKNKSKNSSSPFSECERSLILSPGRTGWCMGELCQACGTLALTAFGGEGRFLLLLETQGIGSSSRVGSLAVGQSGLLLLSCYTRSPASPCKASSVDWSLLLKFCAMSGLR